MNEDHTLIRATLVSAIVMILAGYYRIGENEAMQRFYSSRTARAFADDSTGLYGASALNIAGSCIYEFDGSIDCSRLSSQGVLP